MTCLEHAWCCQQQSTTLAAWKPKHCQQHLAQPLACMHSLWFNCLFIRMHGQLMMQMWWWHGQLMMQMTTDTSGDCLDTNC